MRKLSLTISLLLLSSLSYAQERQMTCDDNRNQGNNRQSHCEIREYPLGSVQRLTADGRTNGGVSVKGSNRRDILVRAMVQTWAPSADEARSLAGQVNVQTAGGNVHSDAPEFGRDRGWAVSYEILVPQRLDLSLKAHNGGIRISDVAGNISFETMNGGASLKRLGGSVQGSTKNGGLSIELAGSRWEGSEMNVSTTNGGVSMDVPENYSARIQSRTVNGRVNIDFPVTVTGRIGRELDLTLGSGGPLIRAVTTNGGVHLKRRS